MSSTNTSSTLRSWSISFAILSLFTLCLSGIALGQTYAGTGTGPIPDNSPGGLTVTFNVAGFTGSPTAVSLEITADHTWVGDLTGTLTAPGGAASASILANTGGPGFGDSSNLGGTYNFVNGGANFLTEAEMGTTAYVLTPGDYAASSTEGTVTVDLNAAFAGLADANGNWTFTISDAAAGDTGSVTVANLTLTGGAVTPTSQKFVDFDGDGKADYSLARDVTPTASLKGSEASPMLRATSHRERIQILKDSPLPIDSLAPADHGENIGWYIANSTDNSQRFGAVGQPATDFITPNDFDGDGMADIAVWRGAASPEIAFYILESTTMTIREDIFGQTNDNPAVVADYDGDGSDDVAVLRCPSTAGQCTFFYRGSAGGGEITFVPWGFGTFFSIFPNTGDFDGDGKADFNVQRTNPSVPGAGQFVLLRSSDFGVEYTNWGANTDLVIPGDYNGDGRSDYAVGRLQGGQRNWYVLSADQSTVLHYATVFGLTGDFPVAADYDGDGSTDIAVWRPEPGATTANIFYVLKSSDFSLQTYAYGLAGDYPPANSKVQ